MTTANKITILRIVLVPFFVAQLLYYGMYGAEINRFLALAAFLVASVLDGVDGYVARHYNQRSELGTVLDPLADKLLLVSAIVVLTVNAGDHFAGIPLWLTVTITGRDVILFLGAVLVHAHVGTVSVRPRISGKVATVMQMILVVWTLLKWTPAVLPYVVWTAAVLTSFSGLRYLLDGMAQLNSSPASGPRSDT